MFGCGWINERHLALLAQDTTPTPARYTKTSYLFDHFHQDYNAKMRLEKKKTFETRDKGAEHTKEWGSKLLKCALKKNTQILTM